MSSTDSTADPLVSVIIPSYNSARWIAETINSVLGQTYPRVEVFVMDDGSTDDTSEVVQPFLDRINYIRQANSGGPPRPRNDGTRLSQGEFLTYLDADDLLHPEKIERQVRFLQAHPSVGVVHGDYVNFDESGHHPGTHFCICPEIQQLLSESPNGQIVLGPVQCRRILSRENFTISSAPMFRREVITRLGGYSETLGGSEDFDMHFRVARHYDVGVTSDVIFYRRMHALNKTNNMRRVLSIVLKSRNLLLRDEDDPVVRRHLKEKIALAHLNLGDLLSGRENRQALSHTLQSAKFSLPFRYEFFRNMAKIGLSTVGVSRPRTDMKPARAP